MTRWEMIEALIAAEIPTVVAAIREGDPSLIRMRNGSKPTPEQSVLITQASVTDCLAAITELEAIALRAENAAFAVQRLDDIMQKHGRRYGEPIEGIDPADLAELRGLEAMMRDADNDQQVHRAPLDR